VRSEVRPIALTLIPRLCDSPEHKLELKHRPVFLDEVANYRKGIRFTGSRSNIY
jgi:hypothetical protein